MVLTNWFSEFPMAGLAAREAGSSVTDGVALQSRSAIKWPAGSMGTEAFHACHHWYCAFGTCLRVHSEGMLVPLRADVFSRYIRHSDEST